MDKILLTISYDGTDYHGWQRQDNIPTVQGKLEEACEEIFGANLTIKGSGRTDAGVHAIGQCATIDIDTPIPLEKLPRILNNILPKDIVVVDARKVGKNFHPQYSAKRKTYRYKVLNDKYPIPQMRNFSYFVYTPLDIKSMQEGAEYFIGTHNFKAFSSAKNTKKDTVRKIYSFEISKEDNIIIFEVCGNGFLHNMVRIMVGTLIDVGKGEINPWDIEDIILSRDRFKAGMTVPASGLTMYSVEY